MSCITVSTPGAPAAIGSDKNHSDRWRLASLSVALLLSSLGTSSANVALPALMHAFDASFQSVQWVVLSYLLAVTTLIVGAGRLGDLIGRRRLLLLGLVVFTAGSALCGAAPDLALLIAGRALQGLGAASMMAPALALGSETAPPGKTGTALGLLGTMSAVGTAVGPSLGGVLISAAGWRTLFLLNVPLGVLGFALARKHLRPDRGTPAHEQGRFDLMGTMLLAVSLGAYALALTLGRGAFGALNWGCLLASATASLAFVLCQRRVASPLLPLGLLRLPGLRAGLALATIASLVVMTTLVVGPFFLTLGLGLGAGATGLVLTVGPLVAATAGLPAGRLVDRLGATRMNVAGLLALAAGCVLLALAPIGGIAGYVIPVALLTAGYALFQTANNTMMLAAVGTENRGTAAGLVTLARNLGLLTGASAMGAVFAFASASDLPVTPPESVMAGMRVTFGVAAVLTVGGLLLVARGESAGAPASTPAT